ncbi:MAG: hypothetical protein C0412_15880 [Flavobacterium sp.]|nr:hypothetical protein [Flavobacterium sp.]
MSLDTRIDLYKDWEKERKIPLLVYITSLRPGAVGTMAGDVINEIIDQIQTLPASAKAVDLLIESTGGDALTAWRIISLLRSKVDKVNIVIPHTAFSAATMLALGGNEILMGQYGSLGPIDPQITVTKKDGTTQQFAYEDIVAFLEFARKEGGLTEQNHLEGVFKQLCDTVEPSALGFASRASALAISIGEHLLQMHMTDSEQKAKASAIAHKLNKSFFNHGHALSRNEATAIGLQIVKPGDKLEEIMWKIHQDFENELITRKPFNPVSEFLSDPAAKPYLQAPPPLYIPPQVDQQVALQILSNYINNQLNISVPDVTRELKYAFVESARTASEFFVKMKILVSRTFDLRFIGSAVELENGWRKISIPEADKLVSKKIPIK